jgi:hypothetical protein
MTKKVREISKQNAAIIREEFRKEKEKEIKALLKKQNVSLLFMFYLLNVKLKFLS